MTQDKHGKQHYTKNVASLNSLVQLLRGCSPDDHILTKRQESSLTSGSPQPNYLNPIKKKLKLEAGLQEGYELEISLGKAQTPNATLVKQEEAGPNPNCKLEKSNSSYLKRDGVY
jgi:hypothetical protein